MSLTLTSVLLLSTLVRVDLLSVPVIMRGSSFKADHQHINTVTKNYYSAINDGDESTWWEPMELKGPHFVEMLWNQPVRISQLSWKTKGIDSATLCYWRKGAWCPITTIGGNCGADFKEAISDRWRISIDKYCEAPKIYELKLLGPEQYILPPDIPSKVAKGRVEIYDINIPQGVFVPGDEIEISFKVKSSKDTGKYGLMIELSDREALNVMLDAGSDFCSGRWAAKPDKDGGVTVKMELPPWTPDGRNDIIVSALEDGTGSRVRLGNQLIGSFEVKRQDLPPMPEPVEQVAIGTNSFGQRGFVINGKWHPAFFNRYYGHPTPERLAATAKTGLNILYWQNRDCIPLDEKGINNRLNWFDQRIKMALRINPNNYFILSQVIKATDKWIDMHPGSAMMLDDGTVNPRKLVSFGSAEYLRESEEFVAKLVRFISAQPYGNRVIGYHLWTCTQNDGFVGGAQPNSKMKDRRDFILGDFNPGAIALFRDFLRNKYEGKVERLRKAWNNEAVDFESAIVSRADLVREDIAGVPFRDPVKSRPAIDYLEFFPTLIGRYNSKIAAAIKRESNGKALVLIHSGAIKGSLCYAWAQQLQSNNNDLGTLLDDPNIDVFVQAQPYDTREAGNAMHVYQPVKSIDLHNKLYLFDHDHRTLGAGILKYGRHRSQYEGESVFRRDYGHQWIDNAGAWISDMSYSRWWSFNEYRLPWFTMPEVVTPIRESIRELKSINEPRKSVAEVAVVISLNSPRYEDACRMVPHYKGLINDLLLQNGLPFLGAPHDVIISSDLGRKNLPEYKLYMFLNPTYFTPDERRAIDGLKRDGKVLAWFYAPGYSTDEGLSLDASRQLTGIKLNIKNAASETPELIFNNNSPISEGLGGKVLTTVSWFGLSKFSPIAISPIFYADDPEIKVGGIYADGTTAYGVKDLGKWKSVWCGVPNFSLEALVKLAQYAGVHLYAEAPIVLNADNRMIMVHNGYEGERIVEINLKRPAKVFDLSTGKLVSDSKVFSIKLNSPETKLLHIKQ